MPFNRRRSPTREALDEGLRDMLKDEITHQGFTKNQETADFFSKRTGRNYSPQRVSDWINGNQPLPRDMIVHLYWLRDGRTKTPAATIDHDHEK